MTNDEKNKQALSTLNVFVRLKKNDRQQQQKEEKAEKRTEVLVMSLQLHGIFVFVLMSDLAAANRVLSVLAWLFFLQYNVNTTVTPHSHSPDVILCG